MEQVQQAREPLVPEPRDRNEGGITRRLEMRRRAGGTLETSLHVRFEFADERRMRELVGEHGRDAECHR